jgi:hypothetical protein
MWRSNLGIHAKLREEAPSTALSRSGLPGSRWWSKPEWCSTVAVTCTVDALSDAPPPLPPIERGSERRVDRGEDAWPWPSPCYSHDLCYQMLRRCRRRHHPQREGVRDSGIGANLCFGFVGECEDPHTPTDRPTWGSVSPQTAMTNGRGPRAASFAPQMPSVCMLMTKLTALGRLWLNATLGYTVWEAENTHMKFVWPANQEGVISLTPWDCWHFSSHKRLWLIFN